MKFAPSVYFDSRAEGIFVGGRFPRGNLAAAFLILLHKIIVINIVSLGGGRRRGKMGGGRRAKLISTKEPTIVKEEWEKLSMVSLFVVTIFYLLCKFLWFCVLF